MKDIQPCVLHDDYWNGSMLRNFCSYCGTPRPSEPKKGLAEKLRDVYAMAEARGHDIPFMKMEDCAITHVLGVVESMECFKFLNEQGIWVSKSSLIKKLKEEGGGA